MSESVTQRAPDGVKHIHHHAYACRDAEETRHFYEDVLGLPLVATVVLDDPFRNDGSRYCHIFFEMSDGNALAFFEHSSLFTPGDFLPRSGFHHHVALEVDCDDAVMRFKRRLDEAGINNMYMDHEVFHSLYFNDPNGLNLEIVTKVPATIDYERSARITAREDLGRWMQQRSEQTNKELA